MNKNIRYLIVGILIGGIVVWLKMATTQSSRVALPQDNAQPTKTVTHTTEGHSMTMDEMVKNLEGKTGNEFDRLFITEMIDHHQGAIDMAKLAQKNAEHQELKDLADAIITSQTSEINQMKLWMDEWSK